MLRVHHQSATAAAAIAIITLLIADVAHAQRLSCDGTEFFRDSTGHMIGMELVRNERGAWSLGAARLDRTGSNRVRSLSVHDDVVEVVLDDIPARFQGRINRNATAILGEWIGSGTRVSLDLLCRSLDPKPNDTSPHRARMVTVAPAVSLEVLDFGGTGRPVILIHGMNQSAHDFDDFAPKLATDFHVYAITRRGSGISSAPDTGYAADRLGDDVLAVMDSLRIVRPVLAGHSYGGAEVSSVGSRHPERIAGLVYLDAAMGYAYLDPSIPDPFGLDGPNGLRCPCSYLEKLNMGMTAYRKIDAPALAIYAMGPDWESTDRSGRSNAHQADAFERGVRGSRVVRIRNADHYVFRSNETDVLREMRAFINGLP